MDIPEPSSLFVIASIISFFIPGLAFVASCIGSLLFLFLGLEFLIDSNSGHFYFVINDYLQLTFGMDFISAYFLIVISILSIPVSVYSIGYTKHFKSRRIFAFFIFTVYTFDLWSSIIYKYFYFFSFLGSNVYFVIFPCNL